MSYPKRAPNLRIITVQDMKFRWRFASKVCDNILSIYGANSYRHPLMVTMLGHHDSWFVFSLDRTKQGTTMGPKFVSQAIAYGLENGWNPDASGPPMQVDYEDGKFSLRQNTSV